MQGDKYKLHSHVFKKKKRLENSYFNYNQHDLRIVVPSYECDTKYE